MNHCPDCGGRVEKGSTEWDKHNMYSQTLYHCDFCQQAWFANWDAYEQETTYVRGDTSDYSNT